MYTQCADCLSIFKVSTELLGSCLGQFRCGHCGSVFSALPTLTEKLPEGRIQQLPRIDPLELPPVLSVPALRPVDPRDLQGFTAHLDPPTKDASTEARREPTLPAEWIVFQPPLAHAAEPSLSAPKREERYSTQVKAHYELGKAITAPSKSARARATGLATTDAMPNAPMRRLTLDFAPKSGSRWPWMALSLLLALSLLAQLAWFQRQDLLVDPELRPWLDAACARLNCQLPLRTEPDELSLLDRDVKPHPRSKGALMISASLRNDARFTQAFPIVEVTLTDLSRRPVALRRFYPHEYLSDSSAGLSGLAPQATLPLVFEVIDPGRQAVNFEFAFLSP